MNSPVLDRQRLFLLGVLWIKIIVVLICVLLAVACGTNSSRTSYPMTWTEGQQHNAAYYFNLMDHANNGSKTDHYLRAIYALLQEKRLQEAKQHIARLPSDLSHVQQNEQRLLLADLFLKEKKQADLSAIDEKSLNQQQKIYFYRIKLVNDKRNKDINAVVRDYIQLEKLVPTEKKQQVINSTWTFFKSLSDAKLYSIIVFPEEITLKGWFDLSFVYRGHGKSKPIKSKSMTPLEENEINPGIVHATEVETEGLAETLSEWKTRYPGHPATLLLPMELNAQDRRRTSDSGTKKVALFLPLQGTSKVFGEVIRAGYTDAVRFYPQEGEQNVLVFDTTTSSLSQLVAEAKAQGATLIVGPLLKGEVARMAKLSNKMPILALNKLNSVTRQSAPSKKNKICYFSLSPEDEAMGAARHIFRQGKRKPLVITANSALGRRVIDAFNESWQSLQRSQVYVQYFDSADKLKAEMNKGRGLDVAGMPINPSLSNLDDTSHQHNEIDAIYVFSSQEELEFIKPMLEMQKPLGSTRKVTRPVPMLYTSSRSQNANGPADYRYEMENVQFSDIPLLVAKNPVLAQLPKTIQRDYSLARLYAMGIDAWRLANRFNQLVPSKKSVFDGLTGQISVSADCNIDRELPWRMYKKGKVHSVQ